MAHAHQFGRPEVSFRYYLTFKTKPLAESFVKQHFELKIKEFSLKMQILVDDKPGYSVPDFFLITFCFRIKHFVVTVWVYGKRNNV